MRLSIFGIPVIILILPVLVTALPSPRADTVLATNVKFALYVMMSGDIIGDAGYTEMRRKLREQGAFSGLSLYVTEQSELGVHKASVPDSGWFVKEQTRPKNGQSETFYLLAHDTPDSEAKLLALQTGTYDSDGRVHTQEIKLVLREPSAATDNVGLIHRFPEVSFWRLIAKSERLSLHFRSSVDTELENGVWYACKNGDAYTLHFARKQERPSIPYMLKNNCLFVEIWRMSN